MMNIWMEMLMAIGVSAVILGGMSSVKRGCRMYLRRRAA